MDGSNKRLGNTQKKTPYITLPAHLSSNHRGRRSQKFAQVGSGTECLFPGTLEYGNSHLVIVSDGAQDLIQLVSHLDIKCVQGLRSI